MRLMRISQKAARIFCLATALLFTALAAVPAMADDEVTWEFQKAEEVGGKLKVVGVMTNNTDKVVTHLGSRSWQYEQDGERVEKSNDKPLQLSMPLQPGGTRTLIFTLANTSEVSDFTVTIHEVTLTEPEDAPPPAAKPAARQASQKDLDAIRVTIISGEPDVEFKEYAIRAALHNNSGKLLRKAKVRLTQNYRSGEPYVKTSVFALKNPLAPNSSTVIMLNSPTRGMTGTNFSVATVDVELDTYEAPERDYGPKKGNLLWTVNGSKAEKDKLAFDSTILNNDPEDIVALNTYTLSFDHDGGRYVSRRGPLTLKNPINAQSKSNMSLFVSPAGAFKNVRNVKVSDVTYMTRPVSARPKTASKASSSSGGSGGNYSFKILNVQSGNKAWVATCEIRNNSSTQPLVRLDDAAISYEGFPGYGRSQKLRNSQGTHTVNIPPLGTKKMSFTFGYGMTQVRNVKFSATPRFGEAKKQGGSGTTIIIKQ